MINRCRESRHVQDYLDAELAEARALAFEEHLQTCAGCAGEVAAYRAMFASLEVSLEDFAIVDPGPSLTERILDRVVPSRLRRRWVQAIGWVYGVSSAVATFAVVSWLTRPTTPVWLAQSYSELSLRVMQSVLFAFQVVTRSGFELLQGWDFVGRLVAIVSPIARALTRPLADPTLGAITAAAMVACVLLLWWMRPRAGEAREGVRNVSLLGF
ncbi:MAG TPA: zf-HC2 domain-containing protein [Candidatus Eisenbacteria bacterium]|nr:zf-HC2 domain-containing protein [Candidatus Eisenbacteria bacterium]